MEQEIFMFTFKGYTHIETTFRATAAVNGQDVLALKSAPLSSNDDTGIYGLNR